MLTLYLDRSLNSAAGTEICGQMLKPKPDIQQQKMNWIWICWPAAICNPHRLFLFGHVSSKTWVYLLPPWLFYAERFWCEFYRPGAVPDASQQKHTGLHLSVTTRTCEEEETSLPFPLARRCQYHKVGTNLQIQFVWAIINKGWRGRWMHL